MAFIIQAESDGGDALSATVLDRIEALELALRWRDAGHTGIKIIGNGRIYTLNEFAGTIVIGEKRSGPH